MREIAFWLLFALSLPFIWRKPFWGIVFYAAINIVRLEMLVWGGDYISNAYSFLFAFTAIATVISSPDFSVKKLLQPQLLLILWLYLALEISLAFSPYQIVKGHYYAFEIFKIFLFCFLMIVLITDEAKVRKFEDVLLTSITFLAVWAIDQHYRGNTRLEGLGGDAFPDTNGVAAMFVIFFPLAVDRIFNSANIKPKILAILSTFTLILAIIFTESRGGLLGLAVGSLAFILRSNRKILAIIVILMFMPIVKPFISSDYQERMATMESAETMDSSGLGRLVLAKAGLLIFLDNPVFGTGFLSFAQAKRNYKDKLPNIDPELREYSFKANKVGHNTFVQLLSEIGLMGSIPFFALVFGNFWANRRIRRRYAYDETNKDMFDLLLAIESGLLGYCVCIYFINAITGIFLYFQIIICVIIRHLIKINFGRTANLMINVLENDVETAGSEQNAY